MTQHANSLFVTHSHSLFYCVISLHSSDNKIERFIYASESKRHTISVNCQTLILCVIVVVFACSLRTELLNEFSQLNHRRGFNSVVECPIRTTQSSNVREVRGSNPRSSNQFFFFFQNLFFLFLDFFLALYST